MQATIAGAAHTHEEIDVAVGGGPDGGLRRKGEGGSISLGGGMSVYGFWGYGYVVKLLCGGKCTIQKNVAVNNTAFALRTDRGEVPEVGGDGDGGALVEDTEVEGGGGIRDHGEGQLWGGGQLALQAARCFFLFQENPGEGLSCCLC